MKLGWFGNSSSTSTTNAWIIEEKAWFGTTVNEMMWKDMKYLNIGIDHSKKLVLYILIVFICYLDIFFTCQGPH